MKAKLKIILLFNSVIFLILLAILFLPSIERSINVKLNGALLEKTKKEALSANIKILQLKHELGENSSSIGVSAGGSGVIIQREANKYYALTAKHVVEELDNIDKTQHIIMGYQDLDLNEHIKQGGEYQVIADYYQKFHEGVVEYSKAEYDLAIISFLSEEAYGVLPVAQKKPQYGDIVTTMSNPYGKRNVVSVGKVISKKPSPFGDEAGELQYPVIRHTAKVSEGSSGSALLNKDLEIVGINLGGNENILRKFISGMAMPSDRINSFLEEWEGARHERNSILN